MRRHPCAVDRNVSAEDGNPCTLRLLDVGNDRRRIARRDNQRRYFLGDEILNLRRLFRRIHLAGDNYQIQILGPGLGLHRVFEIFVERMGLCEQGDSHDRPRRCCCGLLRQGSVSGACDGERRCRNHQSLEHPAS